jgi:hypothetical protein
MRSHRTHSLEAPLRFGLVGACLTLALATFLGCGPSDQERERLKASMFREIGMPESKGESNASSSEPEIPQDQVEQAWMTQTALPIEDWEIQYIGNEPVGFFYRKIERAAAQGEDTLRLTARSRTRLRGREKEAEQQLDFVAFEKENGDVIRFEGSVQVGSRANRFEGSVRDGKLQFNTNLFGRGDSVRIVWNALDRGPFAIEQSLLRSPMKEGEQRQLRYFDPLLGRPIDAQLTAYDYFDTPTFEGKKEKLLEIQITSSAKDDVFSSTVWADPQGRIHKRFTPSLDLRSFRCEKESAMVVVNQAELADLTLRPVPLGGATPLETTKPTRFRVETIDAQYAIELPSRTHQVVQTINERKLDVKVYPAAELNASIEGLEQESQSGEGSLAHSFLIDTNHPDIQQLAKELLQGENIASSDPAIRRVSAFCKGISSRLESTPFDRRVSAGHTTLASGKGDSFDMAALLAAICRSDGIPARIAIGLRCEPKVQPLVMGLHAWTEIHDGQRWLPFDASSSTHMEGAIAADRIKWVDTYWNGINPYESILQLARHLSMLEVSVSRGTK